MTSVASATRAHASIWMWWLHGTQPFIERLSNAPNSLPIRQYRFDTSSTASMKRLPDSGGPSFSVDARTYAVGRRYAQPAGGSCRSGSAGSTASPAIPIRVQRCAWQCRRSLAPSPAIGRPAAPQLPWHVFEALENQDWLLARALFVFTKTCVQNASATTRFTVRILSGLNDSRVTPCFSMSRCGMS
jgi:hypothetical protein